MSHTDKPAWEQLRGQDKSRFILRGIVQRGFKIAAPSTVGFFLTDLLAQRITNPVSETVFLASIYLLLTLLVGWGEGAFIWSKFERDLKIAGPKRRSRRQVQFVFIGKPKNNTSMTHQTLKQTGQSRLMAEARSESSPFTIEFYWVQGSGFRCMAYQDQAGKWYEAFCNWALPGPIRVLE